eukprot:g8716.t1
METGKRLHRVGEGTFGDVFMLRCEKHGKLKALKQTRVNPSNQNLPFSSIREMRSLLEVKNPHIAKLFSVTSYKNYLAFIFEYLPVSMEQILKNASKPLNTKTLKKWLVMLLKGISYCHSKRIIHRDIKPSNILLLHNGTLKISDFGSSRVYSSLRECKYTGQIATKWYRAPELLFGSRSYSPAVDMWAIGSVFAEMVRRVPIPESLN